MSLRVAVQMDPLERINVAGDSTFAIMLKAQELGHELYWYSPEDLSFAEWRLWTMGYPVTVQRVEGDHYSFGEPRVLDLGRDIDVLAEIENARLAEAVVIAFDPLDRDGIAHRP